MAEPIAQQQLRATFFAWERWRLVYNGVLVVIALAWTSVTWGEAALLSPSFWVMCVTGAVVSNVCYWLGPVAECYIVWLLDKSIPSFRPVALGLGTLFTAASALVTIGKPDNPHPPLFKPHGLQQPAPKKKGLTQELALSRLATPQRHLGLNPWPKAKHHDRPSHG